MRAYLEATSRVTGLGEDSGLGAQDQPMTGIALAVSTMHLHVGVETGVEHTVKVVSSVRAHDWCSCGAYFAMARINDNAAPCR